MIGKSVLEILNKTEGFVWTSSNSCVNIKFDNRIVGLVSQKSQMAPTNIFLDFPIKFPQQKCVRTVHGISILPQTISFEKVPVFSGNILSGKFCETTKNKVLSLLDEKKESSVFSLIKNYANEKKWRKIIGAGPGSTPSGDDFLCGALAAEQFLNIKTNIKSEISEVLTPEVTTLLGYTMLKDALANRFPMILHEMICELQCDFSHNFWYNLICKSSQHSPVDFCAGLIWNINRLMEKS